MKTIRQTFALRLALALALSLAGCGHNNDDGGSGNGDSLTVHRGDQTANTYTCPMHPSVRSDRPGACPVCGMALVRKSQQTGNPADAARFQGVSLSPTQRVIANVTTVPAVRRALSAEVNAVGIVAAAEPSQATVAARFRGRIEKLLVNTTGQRVRKGESLFELYSPDLTSAQRDFLLALQADKQATQSGTAGSGTMQKKLLEASRDRLQIHFGFTDTQIARLESSGQISSTVAFLSPISGTVLQKDIQQGMYVEEGMTLYQLADLSTVWAYLDIYERDLRAVKLGQAISVTTEAYPGMTFNGRVTFVDPVVNAGTRTVRVRTEFPNKEGLLKPNMFIRAHLSLASGPSIVVPQSAVLSMGPRTVAWVEVQPNRFEPREVVPGAAYDGQVEILKGLQEGDLVAQTGGFLIDSESSLQQPGLVEPPAAAEHKVQILVDGRYTPDVVRVRRDTRVKLEFVRRDAGACTDAVVFAGLNIRRELPEGKTTVIELPPLEPGEIHYTCGMGMLHGTIIVE
jgi:Cu(I)/Ag(I) efflux system membrane fusion protein